MPSKACWPRAGCSNTICRVLDEKDNNFGWAQNTRGRCIAYRVLQASSTVDWQFFLLFSFFPPLLLARLLVCLAHDVTPGGLACSAYLLASSKGLLSKLTTRLIFHPIWKLQGDVGRTNRTSQPSHRRLQSILSSKRTPHRSLAENKSPFGPITWWGTGSAQGHPGSRAVYF